MSINIFSLQIEGLAYHSTLAYSLNVWVTYPLRRLSSIRMMDNPVPQLQQSTQMNFSRFVDLECSYCLWRQKCQQSWYLQETRLCKSLDLVMLFWHKSINFFFVCAQRNLHHQYHDPKSPIFHLQALPHRYKSTPLPKGSNLILVTPAHLSAIWLCQPQLTMWKGPGHVRVH